MNTAGMLPRFLRMDCTYNLGFRIVKFKNQFQRVFFFSGFIKRFCLSDSILSGEATLPQSIINMDTLLIRTGLCGLTPRFS